MSVDEFDRIKTGRVGQEVYSNFDHQLVDSVREEIVNNPGLAANWPGWNFHAQVLFHDGEYHAQVWTYGAPRYVCSSDNFKDLVETVCHAHGHD